MKGSAVSSFQRIFEEYPTLELFMERILGGPCPTPDQWQVEELAKVRRKARVVVVSGGLPPEVIESLFVECAPSVEAAVAECLVRYGPRASIAAIPKGPYVIAELAAPVEGVRT